MPAFSAPARSWTHAASDIVIALGADVKYRNFIHHKGQHFGTANLRGGATFGPQNNQLKLLLSGEKLRQNDLPTRATPTAVRWNGAGCRAHTALTPFVQYSRLRYRQEAGMVNDVNQTVAGPSWPEALGDNNAMLFLAGFGGKENAVNERPGW